MDNKELLSEKKYQEVKNKLSLISKILLALGGICMLAFIYTFFTGIVHEHPQLTFLSVIGFGMLSFGAFLFFTSHMREVSSFMTQQQMPVAKETAEKMAPTAGVVAKEITKANAISPILIPKQYWKYVSGFKSSLFICPFRIEYAISSFIPQSTNGLNVAVNI